MDVSITNVHLDLGAGRRGTDMGSSAMHVAGLVPRLSEIGHRVLDVGSVQVKSYEAIDHGADNARFLEEICGVVGRLADRVAWACEHDRFPLVLGGDHSQAMGTLAGLARHYRSKQERLGVIWVDAHTDMNTPGSSPTGNIHGMPLAVALGYGPAELVALNGGAPAILPEDVAIIGARDVDAGEAELVKQLGVRVYTMSEVDERGIAACTREAIEHVSKHTTGIHLSFDLDGVDPKDAPGVGTPVPGGLSLRESLLLCELVNRTGRLAGMEVVELNPTLDIENRTGKLGVWLIETALGKTIL